MKPPLALSAGLAKSVCVCTRIFPLLKLFFGTVDGLKLKFALDELFVSARAAPAAASAPIAATARTTRCRLRIRMCLLLGFDPGATLPHAPSLGPTYSSPRYTAPDMNQGTRNSWHATVLLSLLRPFC